MPYVQPKSSRRSESQFLSQLITGKAVLATLPGTIAQLKKQKG